MGFTQRRLVSVAGVLALGVLLLIAQLGVSSYAQRSADAAHSLFLPLILGDGGPPVPTPTPTATATPTAVPCPRDDVSGVYDSVYTDASDNCPPGFPDIPVTQSGTIEVLQTGNRLVFQSDSGEAEGTINTSTGRFQVSGSTTESPCISGCLLTTTGTFSLGVAPMTFTGRTEVDVLSPFGGTICTVTAHVEGTRVSCELPQ